MPASTFLRFFLILLAALLAVTAAAQEPPPPFTVRAWTQQHGLPSNQVIGLSLSRSGHLYVGTPSGVVSFDGQRFTPLPRSADRAFSDFGLGALTNIPGSDDILVAPRTGGLLRLSGNAFIEQALPPELSDRPIQTFFYENADTLWMGFQGGFALRQSPGTKEFFGPSDGFSPHHPTQFARDGDGRVWLANGTVLVRYENGKLLPVPVRSQKELLRIASAKKDGPWIVADEHLYKFENGAARNISRVNTATGAYFLQALMEDAHGALWLGTRSRGLRRMTPDLDVRRMLQAPEDISALLEDDDGNIWVGTTGGGLIRMSDSTLRTFDRSVGLVENRSLSVAQDDEGRMWFANRDGGVVHLNARGRFPSFEPTRRWDAFSAYAVAPAQKGGIWASTTHGLLLLKNSTIRKHYFPEFLLQWSAPRIILAAKNGDLWLALPSAGLCRVRGDEISRFDTGHGLPPSPILSLAEDASGRIWAGGENGQLFQMDEENRFASVSLTGTPGDHGALQSLYFDSAGACWIGTQREGILRRTSSGIHYVNTEGGLPTDNITQIIADDHGAMWFGSPGGIFHIRTTELDDFFAGRIPRLYPVLIGRDEGLAEVTAVSGHQPSVWKRKDGTLWFATRQGIVAIDPEKAHRPCAPLRVNISRIRFNAISQKISKSIVVPSRTQTLDLQISTLHLSKPERARTRYRMLGFDDDWIDAGPDGAVRYVRLPPGKYRFEVSAHLAGVPDSDVGTHLAVHVEAPWWQTPWSRFIFATAFVASLVFAVRRWSQRRLKQKVSRLEQESALERERARIAQNIHDDLGAGLTRISLLTQSAQKNEGEAQLDKIYSTVSELTQSMDEIVWAVNPKNDDLENVANYIAEFAQSYLSDASIRCRVHFPESLPAHVVTAQFRHHLFLICKEALHNIVKHARATDVSIQLEVAENSITLTLSDNGIGIPAAPPAPSHRNGRNNMRARVDAIGGTLQISRASPHGTTITITAPLSPARHTP